MILYMWTNQDIQIIKNNHGKRTLPQIMLLISRRDISYTGFRAKCQRMGLFRDKSVIKIPWKNFHNQNYFEIPNLENCYYAGFIAADGCILLDQWNTYRLAIKLAIKDEIIINEFKKVIDFTGKTSYCSSESPNSEKISNLCYIQIGNFDKNANYLNQHFNITPNKTKRLAPTNLTDKTLNLAFIKGLIDGDGSIELLKNGRKKLKGHLYFGLNSSSAAIIEWFKTQIDSVTPYRYQNKETSVRHHKQDNFYRCYYGGLRAAIILDYLKSIPTPFLSRKWDKPEVLSYIDEQKRKFPHLFIPPVLQTV